MITAQQTRTRYADVQAYLDYIRQNLRNTLATFADPHGFAVISRIKELSSLSEKIESGRFACWSEVTDLIACAVIVPTLADEHTVLTFLQKTFDQVSIVERGQVPKAPDTFRFDSTRFIGRLVPPANVLASEPVYRVPFEIQIRSAFEHAWSVTTHALTYKHGEVAWSRLRLAAQLKASVEQLDTLILGFEETSKRIEGNTWPEVSAKVRLVEFFKTQFVEKAIPPELQPKDWTRFADNVYAMLRASAKPREREPNFRVEAAIAAMEPVIARGVEMIPLSISLIQFIFGSLITADAIGEPFFRYYPLVTDELEELFPNLRGLRSRFDFKN